MSTVLVAGGAGLLGAAVAEELLRRQSGVVVVDVLGDWGDGCSVREKRADRLRWLGASVVRADLADPGAVASILHDHVPDTVVNAALFPPDGPGAGPLLEALRVQGVPYLLHFSGGDLYGPGPQAGAPAREDEALEPGQDPALVARARDEERVRSSGVPHAILRIFTVLGAGMPPGRFPAGELETLLNGDAVPLGSDEPLDLLDVFDAVRAICIALERRPRDRTVNVGSGRPTRPSELLSLLAARAFRPLRVARTATEAGRAHRVADLSLARELLGFEPERTLAASAATIVAARLLPPPEEISTTRRTPSPVISPRPAPSAPGSPRSVSRRDLLGLFRKPLDRS